MGFDSGAQHRESARYALACGLGAQPTELAELAIRESALVAQELFHHFVPESLAA